MKEEICVSIIVPVFNGEKYINKCTSVINHQTFDKNFEVIMVDDGSTDKSFELIKKTSLRNLKYYQNKENSGVSFTRNVGIEKSRGEYIYFMDVDDDIDPNAIKILYDEAKKYDYDFVFSDYKRVVNQKNERINTFIYEDNKTFDKKKILEYMKHEISNPSSGHLGLFGCNGRLIRKSILDKNSINFEIKLRYFEDKVFCWDLFKYINSAKYMRKQLYSYNVFPNLPSAVTRSISHGFKSEYFKLVANKIRASFETFKVKTSQLENLVNQSLIFYIITLLVSFSRSMELGKVDAQFGKKVRRKIIDEILIDPEIIQAAKKYKPSKKESKLIPFAISIRSRFFLELACIKRAKEVVRLRLKGEQ